MLNHLSDLGYVCRKEQDLCSLFHCLPMLNQLVAQLMLDQTHQNFHPHQDHPTL